MEDRRMKMGPKTFYYSISMGLIIGILMVCYMVFLLPSMYLDHKEGKNYQEAERAQKEFLAKDTMMKSGSEAINLIGIIVPKEGYEVEISSDSFQGKMNIPEGKLRNLIDSIREIPSNREIKWKDESEEGKAFSNTISDNFDGAFNEILKSVSASINLEVTKENPLSYEPNKEKIHVLGDKRIIGEFSVRDKATDTRYTSYMGFAIKGDKYYVSLNNTITPTTGDIKPVVLEALPMILLVIGLLALAMSAFFARTLAKPVTDLARDAERRAEQSNTGIEPIPVSRKDEIGELAKALNNLYREQSNNYKKLEEDSKRKEVFMRASSHQLKTPIAASVLLTDGMIDNLGKYGDRDKYLPQLREQLKSMEKMVDEVLKMNHMADNLNFQSVSVEAIVEQVLKNYEIPRESKKLTFKLSGRSIWYTDGEVLKQIIDNLISNGVKYTQGGGLISVEVYEEKIVIINEPSQIDEKLLPDIFQPFVSGNQEDDGHGLGLYVVQFFGDILGLDFNVESKKDEEKVSFSVKKGDKNAKS